MTPTGRTPSATPPTPGAPTITFELDPAERPRLVGLPWHLPIETWRAEGVRHIDVRRGIGRHPVIFIEVEGRRYVVKELGLEASRREVAGYHQLRALGVEALEPVGCVVRLSGYLPVETPAGRQYEPDVVGHTVTRLLERVIPDSRLLPRAFSFESRRRIWDAVVDLFVDLHGHGVYWGDASLANMLIHFAKVDIPYVGRRTELKAVLADAETVEFHPHLSDALRASDFGYFLESMEWVTEDLRLAGNAREAGALAADHAYLRERYEALWRIAVEQRAFEAETGLRLRRHLGRVRDAAYLDTLRTHINEHKWYLSERRGVEVSLPEAADDWLTHVFAPLTELFRAEDLPRLFPGKTAADLYVEVMTHKYYLSRSAGHDVGLPEALHSYARGFGHEPGLVDFWRGLGNRILEVLGLGPGSG
jgi:hypothetical protein